MNHRSAALTLSSFKAIAAVAVLAVTSASPSGAQQRSNAQRSIAPAAQPAAAPAESNPADTKAGLIYSQWTKICTETGEPNAKPSERKRICLTAKEARLESGLPAVGVLLIEPDKDPKKTLRVSLPLGMQLPPGTRIVIDQSRPLSSPYLICLSEGCIAEFDATSDLINRLKKGKQLAVQAINSNGQAIGINLPLGDFAKVVDGPPTDTSAFEEEQKQRAEDVRRRINEARQLVESERARVGTEGGTRAGPQAR
jgi:invasion protein IalB